ncbi:MAG: GNAT family N-acetyltransferase [Treponema sp.]|nr:GNAT family N-acetyltransferase [Treponema sp.]
MQFKPVLESQTDQAYMILCRRIDELITKNTGQYTACYPDKATYINRNNNNENWCLLNDSGIVGIVSLTKNMIPEEWQGIYNSSSNYWLSSFFVDTTEKGNGYGGIILKECIKQAKIEGIKEILLDCYMDSVFLVPYYEKNGFVKIAEKRFKYGAREFSAGLMNKKI